VWRDKIPADLPVIGIGLSVETQAAVAQLAPADAREEENTLDSARGIAKNLYDYMASFSQNTGSEIEEAQNNNNSGPSSFLLEQHADHSAVRFGPYCVSSGCMGNVLHSSTHALD
jgi:hypothetical protein